MQNLACWTVVVVMVVLAAFARAVRNGKHLNPCLVGMGYACHRTAEKYGWMAIETLRDNGWKV